MKKIYKHLTAFCAAAMLLAGNVSAQTGCAISNTTNLHDYGCQIGDQIDYFELDGISNASGCASSGYYEYYSAPTWTLQIGQTYTWTANVGGNNSYDQGLAIWIDLNNDGFFTASEQLANSPYQLTHNGTIMIPFTATPGAGHRMRLRCDYFTNISNTNQTACELGNQPPNYVFYYGETEDYDVYFLPPPPCTGTPQVSSVLGPTNSICPGSSADLTLSYTYTVGDITYVWESSPNSVGPWNGITGNFQTANTGALTQDTWFRTVITCTNSGQSINATPALVQVQTVRVDSVPYFESFEGITENDELPNCSWAADNFISETNTYTNSTWDNRYPHTGNNYASFYYSPGGTNHFYTNEIYLKAGVTYSASIWYVTNIWGDDNWEELSILIGQGQSPTGLTAIATTPGAAAISPVFKPLSNTFTVPQTGNYNLVVRAKSNTNAYAPYLSFDDLQVIVPCELNTPTINISTATSTVCVGDAVNITVTGVDIVSWNTGAMGNTLNFEATQSGLYTVYGTSTLSGCSSMASLYITVNPKPFVSILADKPSVCPGEAVTLSAVGNGVAHNWGIGTGPMVVVHPTASNNVFNVQATNSFGCSSSASTTLVVFPAANVTAQASHTFVCVGEAVTLTGDGAQSYQWSSNNIFINSNPAVVMPQGDVTYSLSGTDNNGCVGTTEVSLVVDACLGISENRTAGVSVYPNPGTGLYTVNTGTGAGTTVEVVDLVGRKVYSSVTTGSVQQVDISKLASGMYYFNLRSGDNVTVVRVIKN